MKRDFPLLPLALVGTLWNAACGSLPAASLNEDRPNLKEAIYGAIWHGEKGSELLKPAPADLLPAEDGRTYAGAVLIPYPPDGSGYVQGVFTLEIPEHGPATFVSFVALPAWSGGAARFEIRVQNGESFPLLAEKVIAPDGAVEKLTADLSPFRGESRMLILSITPLKEPPALGYLWINPALRNP